MEHQPKQTKTTKSKTATVAPNHSASSNTPSLLHLQRTIGNHGVRQLIQQGQITQRQSKRRRIQRFEAWEHQKIGDAGAKQNGKTQMVELADGYSISYGEMVAMAGDLFGNIEEIRALAANPGTGAGTREEIEYVRSVKIPNISDEERAARTKKFSAAAVKAVDQRYYKLAMQNRSHFLNPQKGDENRSTQDKAKDYHTTQRQSWFLIFPTTITEHKIMNSVAGYRKNHVQALFEAYYAGLEGKEVEGPLAVEAFGAHYLTDSFSSGHLRTPRASINSHWNKRVPMFNYNLKGYVAEKLSHALEKVVAGGLPSADLVYNMPDLGFKKGALLTVTEKLDEKGAITFGDVVAGAIHDYDNKQGVRATMQGEEGRLYGDNHLGEGREQDWATMAVNAGCQDIHMAWEAGKKKDDPLVLASRLFQDGLFLAESLIPKAVPDDQVAAEDRRVKWDYDSVDKLMDDEFFQKALEIFAHEKAEEFAKVAKDLGDKDQETAFLEQVVNPLKANPIQVIRDVIHWTPNTGGGFMGHNQDDNAIDYINAAKERKALGTLSVKQKIQLIHDVFSGYTDDDDEALVMEMLDAKPSDVPAIVASIGWDEMKSELGKAFSKKYPQPEEK